MKKTLIALTAIVTLASLANADVIRSNTATPNSVMTVENAQQCWQEQMEKLFTDFEPKYKGTPLWTIKAELGSFTKCQMPGV